MKCPVDGATLVMTERSGVEIDYCPQCRGVWLDRGELDKIIERVALTQGEVSRYASHLPDHGSGAYREYRDDDDDYRRKKRRRGLLNDLFDFD